MLDIFEDGVIFSIVVLLSALIVLDEFALPFLVYAEGRTRSTQNSNTNPVTSEPNSSATMLGDVRESADRGWMRTALISRAER